jgi:hypothetical protein
MASFYLKIKFEAERKNLPITWDQTQALKGTLFLNKKKKKENKNKENISWLSFQLFISLSFQYIHTSNNKNFYWYLLIDKTPTGHLLLQLSTDKKLILQTISSANIA